MRKKYEKMKKLIDEEAVCNKFYNLTSFYTIPLGLTQDGCYHMAWLMVQKFTNIVSVHSDIG